MMTPNKVRSRSYWTRGLAAAFLLATAAAAQVPYLTITVDTIYLQPNQPGQVRTLEIANTSGEDFLAKGLNLRIGIDDRDPVTPAPVFVDVNALQGTPWESQLPTVDVEESTPEYWDVRLSLFATGGQAVLGAQSKTKLATVTFDTTGLSPGTWDFKLADRDGLIPWGTDYSSAVDGDQVIPTIYNGQLIVVPEPRAWALAGAVSLFGWGVLRRRITKRST